MTIAVHGPEQVDAVPLVLLHAFPLDSRMWDDVVEQLPEHVPVVRMDAPGFGGTPARTEPGLDRLALEVVAAVRELGADEAVVAGLSMGGYLTMAIAELAPGLLAGVGLLCTKAGRDPDAARDDRLAMADAVERGDRAALMAMMDRLLGPTSRAERPAVVERVRGWVEEAPAEGVAWAQRSMAARPDRLDALAQLPDGLAALVLRGEEDMLPADDAAAMAQALGTSVVEVPGAGHLAALERPEPVAAALADLYARATA